MVEEYDLEKYKVIFLGEVVHYINPRLAARQGLTDLQIDELKDLHIKRCQLYERFTYFLTQENSYIPELLKEYTAGEFAMQRLWGFPEDANYHRFWDIPACTCPRMDNNERVGTPYHITSSECPLHGSKV